MKQLIWSLSFVHFLSTAFADDALFKKRCEEGHLKDCVSAGKSASQNGGHEEAVKFYKKACDGNDMNGCSGQAAMEYRLGNVAVAKKLFEKSCQRNEEKACEVLKRISEDEKIAKSNSAASILEIKEFIRLMALGADFNMRLKGIHESMIKTIENVYKKPLPEDIKNRIKEIINEELKVEKYIDLLVPVYQKHYTSSEISELLRFYQSPVGKKHFSISTNNISEFQAVGLAWANEGLDKYMTRIKDLVRPLIDKNKQ